MKKNANYEINFAINTITVTKRFLAAASQIGTQEYATMTELRKLQMPITVREIHRTVKETRWNYARIEDYLRNVVDSERYLADYAAVRDGKGYMGTWAWFKKTFPKYAEVPELDENHHYMILPCDYQEDEETVRKIA